ncbi:MAG TPA: hypothetical protein VMF03_09595 [Steroidobacteraceae bacterium]|nr:hypothetical protein [Steroidobacteraceae bacterium]
MQTTRQRCEPGGEDKDLDEAWRRYCAAIRELEMTPAELEALRRERLQRPAGTATNV